jgi:methanogenic corrinoid protein MtbC1
LNFAFCILNFPVALFPQRFIDDLKHQADIVGISSTMLFNLPRVRALIQAIRETCRTRPPRILVGGGAFRSSPSLWQELGADGYAVDLRQAVAAARAAVNRY